MAKCIQSEYKTSRLFHLWSEFRIDSRMSKEEVEPVFANKHSPKITVVFDLGRFLFQIMRDSANFTEGISYHKAKRAEEDQEGEEMDSEVDELNR